MHNKLAIRWVPFRNKQSPRRRSYHRSALGVENHSACSFVFFVFFVSLPLTTSPASVIIHGFPPTSSKPALQALTSSWSAFERERALCRTFHLPEEASGITKGRTDKEQVPW